MEETTILALRQYSEALAGKTLAEYGQLPDLGLYMDQVITYLGRQLDIFMQPGDEGSMTPSMINNYAKARIVPRTEGKKYGQEHIALLLAVFTLKRVLSVQDMSLLFGDAGGKGGEAFFERFRQSMEHSAKTTSKALENLLSHGSAVETEGFSRENALRNLALEFSVEASVKSYAAEMLLAMANPEKGEKPERKKGKKASNRKAD